MVLSKLFRRSLRQFLTLFIVGSISLMLWKTACLVFSTEAPVVVVLTGSMEPAFERGDILLLRAVSRPVLVGEIVIYRLKNQAIPIVHRVIETHYDEVEKKYFYLTKGDNNMGDDRSIYTGKDHGKQWVYPEDLVGVIYGFLPKVGYMTIFLNENTVFKFLLLGGLGLLTMMTQL